MLKTYKYRIYPNQQQKELIDKTFGICRLVYNLALETKIRAWQSANINLSAYDLQKQVPDLKRAYPWMREVDSNAILDGIKNIDKAFKNFFNGGGFPKFKKKTGKQSFQWHNSVRRIDWINSTLNIPKIKEIPIILSKTFEGQIRTITISKTTTGKYFASILVDDKQQAPVKPIIDSDKAIGIDLGIKSFAVISDGQSFEPNQYLKASLNRLKSLQHRADRKKKGSNNQNKANKKVALLYEKIANQRVDYIHKITTGLVRDSQANTFVIEDLHTLAMLKNRSLSKVVQDASFGEFGRQMKYKCNWHGKNLIVIGRFEPSSKTCSSCGVINDTLTLAHREWQCKCGATHDRDLNAAKNILKIGIEKYSGRVTPGEPVESRRLCRAKKQELCIT